jgi:hypothetical protein
MAPVAWLAGAFSSFPSDTAVAFSVCGATPGAVATTREFSVTVGFMRESWRSMFRVSVADAAFLRAMSPRIQLDARFGLVA